MQTAMRWALVVALVALVGDDARAQDELKGSPATPLGSVPRAGAPMAPKPATKPSDWYVQEVRREARDAKRQSRCLLREQKRVARSLAAVEKLSSADRDTQAYEAAREAMGEAHMRLTQCHSVLEPNVAFRESRQTEPKCRPGDPLCSDLPSEAVQRAVAPMKAPLTKCYRGLLEQDHVLEGTVQATLALAKNDKVPSVELGERAPKPLRRCASVALKGVRFSRQAFPRTFEIALDFAPN